jgi:hypothetical protein
MDGGHIDMTLVLRRRNIEIACCSAGAARLTVKIAKRST